MTLTAKEQQLRLAAEKATEGPWFFHDFSHNPLADGPFTASDVTVSCDNPATMTVAFMGGGRHMGDDRAGLIQARYDADYISQADPGTVKDIITELAWARGIAITATKARIAKIDKRFEEAEGWGSWMFESSIEREFLVSRLARLGVEVPHKYQARSDSGEKTD